MDLDGFNIIGRDSEIGRRAMDDPEAPYKSSGGMSVSDKLRMLSGESWLSSTSAERSSLMAVLPQIVAVVEAAEEVAPFLPPARQWLRQSLAALDEALS